MEFTTLVQTFGLPIAMLLVAVVVILRYFIRGEVVPRWAFDATVAERDRIIAAQAAELAELRKLVYRSLAAAEQGAKALEKGLP